jgi:outer membrane receptor for ferrienterochelin and colicin
MDITQLMNVTVTSVSKREQQMSDAAAAVFIISQEDIRRSGVTIIPDALAMAPAAPSGAPTRSTALATRKWPSCHG